VRPIVRYIGRGGLHATVVFFDLNLLYDYITREFRRFANKAEIGIIYVCMDFQNLLTQNGGFLGKNKGRGGALLTPNEFVLTFTGCCLCVSFGENR